MATMEVMDINSNPQWRAEHPEVMEEYAETIAEVDANAKLVTHCCNNFMKALAALKRVAENAGDNRGRDGEYIDSGLHELIKELETVE
jgi:hypothetical protein